MQGILFLVRFYWLFNEMYMTGEMPEGWGEKISSCLYEYIAVPLQARSGPEVSRKLRFPDIMTTAQDSGKVVSLTHRPTLPPGNAPGPHFC